MKERYEEKGYDFPLCYGRMRRIIGDFAFIQGDYEASFAKYAEGFPLINGHGGYGPYSIDRELSKLSQKLQVLSRSDSIHWLKYLQQSWSEKSSLGRVNLVFWCEQQLLQAQLRLGRE